jgi:hypothetical protein
MATTGIEWASSDIVYAVTIIRKASKALSVASSCLDAYAESQSFLEGFGIILSRFEAFADDQATSTYTDDIAKYLTMIKKPGETFKLYLESFDGSLNTVTDSSVGSSAMQDKMMKSRVPKITRPRRTIRWAFDDLDDQV